MRNLLILAGFDPTGGAGILADARVASLHGMRGIGVVTATTVQDTTGVHGVQPSAPSTVEWQLRTLLDDIQIDGVKIGMLGDEQMARVVANAIAGLTVPVVWDPVLMPSRGGIPLFRGDVRAVMELLLPRVRVVTPNISEVEAIAGVNIVDVSGMRQAATALRAAGAKAVLVKGGHLPSSQGATDVLDDDGTVVTLAGERLDTGPVHGTGCVLSTALACNLADGQRLPQAAAGAKAFLTERLRAALPVGRGAKCLV